MDRSSCAELVILPPRVTTGDVGYVREVLAIVLIVVGAVACVVLFVIGLVAPKRSRKVQRAVDRKLDTLQGESARAPGRLATWLAKPFGKSEKATNKSARAGRKTRSKLPF